MFMLYRHSKNALLALALLAASASSALADDVSVQTRFGVLKTNPDGDFQFKGKSVAPAVNVVTSSYVLATYKLGTSDVVFVSQAAGNACPGQYAFIVVTADGARATPTFGTCYDDDVKPTQVGESIAFSMKKMGGKGSVRYVYERGVVFENGKPVQ
jgi:hypothetical protein